MNLQLKEIRCERVKSGQSVREASVCAFPVKAGRPHISRRQFLTPLESVLFYRRKSLWLSRPAKSRQLWRPAPVWTC